MKTRPGEVTAAGILLMCRGPSGRPSGSQFLLLRHPDRWDLPKGHAERGETPRETAIRETVEETGLSADRIALDPDFQFTIRYAVPKGPSGDRLIQKTVHYFLGWLDQPCEVVCTEHSDYRWFDWPPAGPIQRETIDPLLDAVADHLRDTSPGA